MNTIDTDTQARLTAIRAQDKPSAEDRAWRNGQIARLVHAGVDKDAIAMTVGMGVPQINRIARTTEDGPAPVEVEDLPTIATDQGTVIAEQRRVKPRKPKAIEVPSEGITFLVSDTSHQDDDGAKAKAEVVVAGANAQIVATVGAFDPAPAGDHVPPRVRTIRRTGSLIAFGHASRMGYPSVAVNAKDWVSRCITHGAEAHFERRGDARYQDGTEYCLDCAAAAKA